MFQRFSFRTEVYFYSLVFLFVIQFSKHLEYECKRNEKEVLYIEDSILAKSKFGVFKACFTERLKKIYYYEESFNRETFLKILLQA